MVSVVGDDGSGDPLHERCDESDVYEGEVAQRGRGSGARWVVRWSHKWLAFAPEYSKCYLY